MPLKSAQMMEPICTGLGVALIFTPKVLPKGSPRIEMPVGSLKAWQKTSDSAMGRYDVVDILSANPCLEADMKLVVWTFFSKNYRMSYICLFESQPRMEWCGMRAPRGYISSLPPHRRSLLRRLLKRKPRGES